METSFKLTQVLAIYKRPTRIEDNEVFVVNDHYYIETHDVIDGKPGAGSPISTEALSDMAKLLKKGNSRTLSGNMSRQCLHVNPTQPRIVWIVKAAKRELLFSEVKIKAGKMNCPTLIFDGTNKELKVFAINSNHPVGKEKLLHAPFLNVYADGKLCIGTASLHGVKTAKSFDDFMQAWEDVFFKSKFSHAGFDGTRKKNLQALTKKLIRTGGKFPIGQLLQTKHKSLDSYLKK